MRVALKTLLPLVSTVLVCLPLGSTAVAATLSERIRSLAVPPDVEGISELHYTESRSSSVLASPVIYQGRLAYDPAQGTLTKWVDEPRQARLTLNDTELEAQSGNGRVRRLPLERQPELAALLGGMRALLTGDEQALQGLFQADYLEGEAIEGKPAAWVLQLRPLDPEVAGRLVLLELRGIGSQLTQLDSLMGSGERQSMRILAGSESTPDSRDD